MFTRHELWFQTGKITSVFYKHAVEELGHLDYTQAAFALWMTMRSLNGSDVPLNQQILYMHFGA